ncbi:hypothetical protein [Nibribacter koreensis]|uniref:Tetratricopeptide repeat-containing protein n=1 Tax=Nibribacter koreensis TaxID=1084519 RepID=A0ABP8FNS0_9BACT
MQRLDKQVERNLKGMELEKAQNLEQAISLYEENVKEKFDGSHPYERLSIIYKKLGKIEDEIRVLELAVSVYNKETARTVLYGNPKLGKFKDKLTKALERKNKTKL